MKIMLKPSNCVKMINGIMPESVKKSKKAVTAQRHMKRLKLSPCLCMILCRPLIETQAYLTKRDSGFRQRIKSSIRKVIRQNTYMFQKKSMKVCIRICEVISYSHRSYVV